MLVSLAASALICSLGACGQGSAGVGEDDGTSSASASTNSGASASASTNSGTTAPTTFTDGPDECGDAGLDECEIGDIGERSCNIIFQDCPNTYKCVPFWPDAASTPDYRCVSVTGALGPGDVCALDSLETGNDNCDEAGFCWSYGSGQLEGRCHPFCTGGFQYAECIDGWECSLSDVTPPMCIQSCVPLAGGCAPGSQCLWIDPDFNCVPEGAGLGPGEPCLLANDCAPQLLCVDGLSLVGCEGDDCCAAYCAMANGDGPCQMIDPAYACVAFFEDPPPPGLGDVGLCVAP